MNRIRIYKPIPLFLWIIKAGREGEVVKMNQTETLCSFGMIAMTHDQQGGENVAGEYKQ